MSEATYLCYGCNKTHKMRFAAKYVPFLRWLMTCPKCRKYHLQRLVQILNPCQSKPGPVHR